MRAIKGFTLVELMLVVIVLSILMAIALPSYRQYLVKKQVVVAQQVASEVSKELERFKSKNFSYKSFTLNYLYSSYNSTTGTLTIPVGATDQAITHTLTLLDATTSKVLTSTESTGLEWVIKVERVKQGELVRQPYSYDLLMTSKGIRCMTRVANQVSSLQNCGSEYEDW